MIAALMLAASLWTPQDLARVQRAVDAALGAPTLRGSHVGLLAVDADSGATIYSRAAGDAFTPASTFKLLVGSAALAKLGPAFAFATEVDAAGATLALKGGGDAKLSAGDLDTAAAAVAATGVTHYDALIGDATRYEAARYPDGWSIDDLPYDYAAIPSALCLEENTLHAYVSPGDGPGDLTTLSTAPATDAIVVENESTTGSRGSDDTTDVARSWSHPKSIRVIGSYPLGAKISDDLAPAVPDPAAYALDVFRIALTAHGITIGTVTQAATPANATVVWRHASAPLAHLLGEFWQPSDNLVGEQLLLELGASSPAAAGATSASDTRERGIAAEQAWLRSIDLDPATVTIADGSGLSEYDRVTPADLVAILRADWNGPQRATVLDALPLAGIRGTLKSSFTGTPLQGTVFAKTGTINHARTLAGYLRTPRRGTIAFALLINDWMDASPGAAAAVERVREAALEALRD